MKNRIAFLLLTAMLASLAACGGTDTPAADTTAGDTTAAVTTAPSEYVKPDVDYGGKTVTVAVRDIESVWKLADYNITLSEENGDIINDALVKAKRNVEETLNVTVELYPLDQRNDSDLIQQVKKPILAGDHAFDFALPKTGIMPSILAEPSLVIDLNEVDTLDLSHSWWYDNATEEYNLYGRQLCAVGDICFYNSASGVVTYFNKQLAENFKLENMYDLVRSGKWTIDKMAEMCAAVANDLNGNGQVDKEDRFGLLAETTTLQYFVTAGGVRFSDRDNDGELYLSVYGDRVIGVVEKLVPLMNSAEQTMMAHKYAAGYNNVYFDLFLPVFFDNRALFYSNQLLVALEMRAMDGDFGILPTPKYDEAQKEYYTIGNTAWSENLIVPATSTELDMIGHVIEAYGYQAQQHITPAFVDFTVLDKSIRDEDSAEMVELILDTQTFDLAYIFDWGKCRSMLNNLANNNNVNYASAYDGIKSAAEAAMAATVAEIKGK